MLQQLKVYFVLAICLLFLVSCGGSATGKLVAGYKIGAAGVYHTDNTIQDLKAQGLLTVEQLDEYNKLYAEVYRYAGLTKDALKLYIETEDAVQKKMLKERYTELLNKFLELGDRLVVMYKAMTVGGSV